MKRIILFLLIALAFVVKANAKTLLWTPTNGPYGGSVKQVALNSKGDAFMLAETGKLYKNESGSDLWTYIADSVKYFAVDGKDNFYIGTDTGSIELFDPHYNFLKEVRWDWYSGRKLTVTNRGGIYVNYYSDQAIYYSSDNGSLWTIIPCPYPGNLAVDSGSTAMVINPPQPQIIRITDSEVLRDTIAEERLNNTGSVWDVGYNKKYNPGWQSPGF